MSEYDITISESDFDFVVIYSMLAGFSLATVLVLLMRII